MINPAALIGAIIGFSIGAFYLRSFLLGILLSMLGSSIGSRMGSRKNRESGWFTGWRINIADGQKFSETLFSMMGKLAAADGYVSSEEERLFRSIVINELRITSPASVAAAMKIFHQASSSEVPVSEYARRAAGIFGNRPQLLEMMLLMMIRVCAVSDGIHPDEDKMLREIAEIFGYSAAAYESIRSRYTFGGGASNKDYKYADSNLTNAYSIFGVNSDATEEEIRKAYRKKAAEYHPDKIAAKGLPEDFTAFANEKFQEIQNAWETIRKAKGW